MPLVFKMLSNALLAFLYLANFAFGQDLAEAPKVTPEQIHLSWGADATQMIVTWNTLSPLSATHHPTVSFGTTTPDKNVVGKTAKYQDTGKEKRVLYIHRAVMKGLKPDTKYVYRVGSTGAWSKTYSFKTIKPSNDWTTRFCVYGDLGLINGRAIGPITQDVKKGMYDALIHVGDIAYNLDFNNTKLGDQFMRKIEPIAANLPYQILPGNHERGNNFSNYDHRFFMVNSGSGKKNNHFWSYDFGPIHFVAFSTEFYYFPKFYTKLSIQQQFKWLTDDLKKANLKENRAKRPWIIAMGHRPLYYRDQKDTLLIKGVKSGTKFDYGLEKLFFDQGVDLQIYGHVHHYERMYPMYDAKIMASNMSRPYVNPKGPVHMLTGAPGNHEKTTPAALFVEGTEWPKYTPKASNDYSYTRMYVNKTHLKWEQISITKGGQIIDECVITQNNHGPFKKI